MWDFHGTSVSQPQALKLDKMEDQGDLSTQLRLPEQKKSKVSFNDDRNSVRYITDSSQESASLTTTEDTRSEQSDKIDFTIRPSRVSSAMDNLREYKAPVQLTRSREAMRRKSRQESNRRLFYTGDQKKKYDLWDSVPKKSPSTRSSSDSEPSYVFTGDETEDSSLLGYSAREPLGGVSRGYDHEDFRAPEVFSLVDMAMQMSLCVLFVYVVFSKKKSWEIFFVVFVCCFSRTYEVFD